MCCRARSTATCPGGPIRRPSSAEFRNEEMVYNTDIPKGQPGRQLGPRRSARRARASATSARWASTDGRSRGSSRTWNSASVRYDDYSDFGATTNPKVSFRYSPSSKLLFRGSYNAGFAAPCFSNLYLPQLDAFTSHSCDPALCPGGVPLRRQR